MSWGTQGRSARLGKAVSGPGHIMHEQAELLPSLNRAERGWGASEG